MENANQKCTWFSFCPLHSLRFTSYITLIHNIMQTTNTNINSPFKWYENLLCYEFIIKLLYIIFHQKRETTERVGSRTTSNECSTTGQKIHYIAEILREGKLRGLVSFKISMNINGFSKSWPTMWFGCHPIFVNKNSWTNVQW